MTTIDEYLASLAELNDDDLLNLHIAVLQAKSSRGQAALKNDPTFYYNQSPNNWHKTPLNVDTLKDMGRNPNGSPKEKK